MGAIRRANRSSWCAIAAASLLAGATVSCSDDDSSGTVDVVTATTDCTTLRSILRSYRDDMERAAINVSQFGGPVPIFGPFGPGLNSSFSPLEPLSAEAGIVEAGQLAANDDWVVHVDETGSVAIVDRATRVLRDTVRVPGQSFLRRLLLAEDRAIVISNSSPEGPGSLTFEPLDIAEIDLNTGEIVDTARIDGGYQAAAVVDGTPVVLTWSQPYLATTGGGFGGEVFFSDDIDDGDGEVDLETDDTSDEEIVDAPTEENADANERLADWISVIELSDGTETRPPCEQVLLPLGGGIANQTGLLTRIGPDLDLDSVGLVGSPGGLGVGPDGLLVAVNVGADDETGTPGHSTIYNIGLGEELSAEGEIVVPGMVSGRRWISTSGDVLRVVSVDDRQRGRIDTFRWSDAGELDALGSAEDIGRGLVPLDVRFHGDLAFVATMTDPIVVISLADPTAPTIIGELGVAGVGAVVSPEPGLLLAVGADARLRGGEVGTVLAGYRFADGELAELGTFTIEDMDPALTDVRSLTVANDGHVVVPSFNVIGRPAVEVVSIGGSVTSMGRIRHQDPDSESDPGTDCEIVDDETILASLPPGMAFPGLRVLLCEEDDRGGLEGYSCNVVTRELLGPFPGLDDAFLDLPDEQRYEACFPNGPTSMLARPVVIDGEVWLADSSGILVFNADDLTDIDWID